MVELLCITLYKSEIDKVVKYAKNHVVPLDDMIKLSRGDSAPVPGDLNECIIDTKEGYRIVYSHEEQPKGICRHLSISWINDIPDKNIVEQVCKNFGFVNHLSKCIVWPEKFGNSRIAINVVEPIDGDWTKHKKDKYVN